jgi:hypothetical protein
MQNTPLSMGVIANGVRGGAIADPSWSLTKFLLNTVGPDNDTAGLTDASASAHTVTAVGNAKIISNRAAFDGTGDYLSVPGHSDFQLGANDFTLETRQSLTNHAATGEVCLISLWTTGAISFFMGINNTRNLVFYYSINGSSGVFSIVGSTSISTAADIHLAVTRAGNIFRLFQAGVKVYEGTHAVTLHAPSTSVPLTIGGNNYSVPMFNGSLTHRNTRIKKGVALYTADFTPPTGPFAAG